MKRTALLFLVFLLLLGSLCGCKTVVPGNAEQSTTQDSTSTTGAVANTVPESLSEKLVRQMKEAYLADSKKSEYFSTAGQCELHDEYRKKWKDIADTYYNKIMEYDDIIQPSEIYYTAEDLHTFVTNMKTNWEQYSAEQYDNYTKTLVAIYQAGTIVGPLSASYKCELQKDWALQLVKICEQLYIE